MVRQVFGRREISKAVRIILEYVVTILINAVLAAGIGHTFQVEGRLIIFSIFYSVLRVSTGGAYLKLEIKNSIIRWVLAAIFLRVFHYYQLQRQIINL